MLGFYFLVSETGHPSFLFHSVEEAVTEPSKFKGREHSYPTSQREKCQGICSNIQSTTIVKDRDLKVLAVALPVVRHLSSSFLHPTLVPLWTVLCAIWDSEINAFQHCHQFLMGNGQ